MQRYKMANDLGRGWSQKCFQCLPFLLRTDPQNSLPRVFSVHNRHGDDAFVDKQQQRDVMRFICRGFAQQEDISKSCCFLLLSEDQPSTCSLLPHRPLLCLLKAAYSHCRWVFSRCCNDTYGSFDPWPPTSVSEAGLGFGDVDFDAVCALRSGVLAKGRSLFGSQQTLASLLPLLLR